MSQRGLHIGCIASSRSAGVDRGLFKSTDDGQSWSNFGPNTVPVNSVGVASDGAIYAGTIGQGVWRFGK